MPARAGDIADYKFCAGRFWAMHECVVPQFREAYSGAFMVMARTAAELEVCSDLT